MAERGVDLAFGRTLPRLLRAAGLVDIAADAYFPISGPACLELERATIQQIRGRLLAAGLADLSSGRLPELATSPMISAWGRRPGNSDDGLGDQ